MKIAEWSIRNKTITLSFVVLAIIGGVFSFNGLGRLEDPEFTIKEAQIITYYPGATAAQVEQEVTDRIEIAVQQLGQLKRVTSISKPGLSIVSPVIQDKYDKSSLPQVWDELRRKVNDVQSQLPPGAGPSIVNDDYGDVYGILFALTGKGFSYRELEKYADLVKKELLLIGGVAKVEIFGVQQQQVIVEISRDRIAQLGISPKEIYMAIENQNMVAPSGAVKAGVEYIRIFPTGVFTSITQIGDIVLRGNQGKLIYLKDIAKIYRDYVTPPSMLIDYNGEKTYLLGISVAMGGNVVTMGEAVKKRLDELQSMLPLGLEIDIINFQADSVTLAIDGFISSLLQALGIVIVVLMLFMGLRSGFIIGIVLLLTVLATFIGMKLWGVNLERISLGALIIALGMLVDNAIVVTEGMLIKIKAGMDRIRAANEVVSQTALPLLGATVIAILAFAAIGMSQDSTGEYTRSLFQVILISLSLSWIIAITVTPLLCHMLIKVDSKNTQSEDPYSGFIFRVYRQFLSMCLKLRWLTVTVLLCLLMGALYLFSNLETSFFPDSTRPQFLVHFWLPEGTDIRATEQQISKLQEYINTLDGVDSVTTFVGGGAPRFLLTYAPEKMYSSYGMALVNVDNYLNIGKLMPQIQLFADKNFADAQVKIRKFMVGPGRADSLEARFAGDDPSILRSLSNQAKTVMHENGGIVGIKDDWRERVKVAEPIVAEQQARELGITKNDIDNALQTNFTGMQIGVYREQDKLLPILSRAPLAERNDISELMNIQLWSPVAQQAIPIRQILGYTTVGWQDQNIQRRNRIRTITTQASQATGNASVVFNQIRTPIESITLPPGYFFEWGGEYEDSRDAQAALFSKIPLTVIMMVFILIMLFNAIRQPLIIILTLPLAVIGVSVGLYLTGQSFGFMALLGFLSLSGMLIKNAVVLIDQINLELSEGKKPWDAILDSCASRLRPVSMAAITTVLGMIPLLTDAFFIAMAVTIMAGLTFATVLTMIFVPVLYAIFFRINESTQSHDIIKVETGKEAD